MARHPNKHIREAIRYAEQHGWTLRISRGHAFGRLYCPHPCLCQIGVHSTPRNPEGHARWLRREIDKCPKPIGGAAAAGGAEDRESDEQDQQEEEQP